MNETNTASRRFQITARPYYTVDDGIRWHDIENADRPLYRANIGDYVLLAADMEADTEGDIRGTLERTGKYAYLAMAVLEEVQSGADRVLEGLRSDAAEETTEDSPEVPEPVIRASLVRSVLVLVGMDESAAAAFVEEASK